MPDAVLLIEPFYGGSHRQLMDTIHSWLQSKYDCHLITQSACKWHWRARTAALNAALNLPKDVQFRLLFCSSVLNLCELVGLCPHLHSAHKVVYFHENQLIYPQQRHQGRDFQFGYNEILTCLAADVVLFNSKFNQDSFLSGIPAHIKLMPDDRPKGLEERIRPKCRVLHFPMEFPTRSLSSRQHDAKPLHILWPHRWEHDKNPVDFFTVLFALSAAGHEFRLSVLGESYGEKPDIFTEAQTRLAAHIVHWGRPATKEAYYDILSTCDVVVSTAMQETFGVAMLEAVHLGCFPLCPNRLVYPELFPSECLYNTNNQLTKGLTKYAKRPDLVKVDRAKLDLDVCRYSWTDLKGQYADALHVQ